MQDWQRDRLYGVIRGRLAAIIYEHATTEADARIAAAREAELAVSNCDSGQADDRPHRLERFR